MNHTQQPHHINYMHHMHVSTQNLVHLIGIYFFVISAVMFADISYVCSSRRFNLSVIFLIGLIPSKSAKISVTNSLLISETVFLFTAKISNALCWIISREVKIFSFTLHVSSHLCIKNIFHKNLPTQKCGAKSTRSVTVTNQLDLGLFRQNIFSFQPVEKIDDYRSV